LQGNGFTPERALIRLRQLAAEQRAAIAHGDVEALCRISDLLPATVGALGTTAPEGPGAQAIIDDARQAQVEVEQFLSDRMNHARSLLQQIARSRNSSRAYAGQTSRASRVDGTL
jgi:hypothetical protein